MKNNSFLKVLPQVILKNYPLYRFVFLLLFDFLFNFSSIITAIYLYTRVVFVPYTWGIIYAIIAISFFIRLALFSIFKIYNISFQHASALYIVKVSFTIILGVLLNYFLVKALFPSYWFFVIATLAALFDIIISVSFRFFPLIYYEMYNKMGIEHKNCVIYGCGDTGIALVNALIRNKLRIIGFIDDDPNKLNKIINGIKVLGRFDALEKITTRTRIDVLIVAVSSMSGRKLIDVKQACSKFNIDVKVIPSLYQIYNRSIEQIAASVRNINYEDLLRREIKKEDFSKLSSFFESKRIIVSGAGSIGNELIHQLAVFPVKEIIALDNSELSLFNLENGFEEQFLRKIRPTLLDLKNRKLLEKLMLKERPDIAFHTVAYKHVPIVERHICEGVYNNLACLKNMFEVSEASGVEKFIFISSDKAVRPTNMMGATKRLGELYIQVKNGHGGMKSSAVRFGNVIGSSGSLIPKIISQIQRNLAVTVTHPETSRFFMLISEAVLLILKAAVITNGGEIFILDMGKPIRIVDIVKDIINFYGKVPDKDIQIDYIGLRPGEKLFEELFLDDIEHRIYGDGMYITRPKLDKSDNKELLRHYDDIIYSAQEGSEEEMVKLIKQYVKIYTNEELSERKSVL